METKRIDHIDLKEAVDDTISKLEQAAKDMESNRKSKPGFTELTKEKIISNVDYPQGHYQFCERCGKRLYLYRIESWWSKLKAMFGNKPIYSK